MEWKILSKYKHWLRGYNNEYKRDLFYFSVVDTKKFYPPICST